MLDYRVRTFLEVYRQRSFTRAAERLLITQPAASQHIRHLEAHYGCPLFEKTGRGVVPTAAADILYRRLEVLENDEERIGREVRLAREENGRETNPLRFGCTRTVADYAAPLLVATHLESHRQAAVTMRVGNTHDLVCELEQGTIDFALVEGSFDRQRFDHEVLSSERYIAVAALAEPATPDEPAASIAPTALTEKARARCAGRTASIRDLLAERLILRESGSGTREILEKHLAARDLSPSDFASTVEIGSIPTIKACVKAGTGISFMYRIAVERELAEGELVDITPRDFEIEHDFCLIWQRGSQYGPRFRALAAAWRALM